MGPHTLQTTVGRVLTLDKFNLCFHSVRFSTDCDLFDVENVETRGYVPVVRSILDRLLSCPLSSVLVLTDHRTASANTCMGPRHDPFYYF